MDRFQGVQIKQVYLREHPFILQGLLKAEGESIHHDNYIKQKSTCLLWKGALLLQRLGRLLQNIVWQSLLPIRSGWNNIELK